MRIYMGKKKELEAGRRKSCALKSVLLCVYLVICNTEDKIIPTLFGEKHKPWQILGGWVMEPNISSK